MASLKQKVLKESDLPKVEDLIKKSLPTSLKEEKIQTYADIFKLCQKLILHLRKKIRVLIKGPGKKALKGMKVVCINMESIVSYLEVINDAKAQKKAGTVLIKCNDLVKALQDKSIKTVSELQKKLKVISGLMDNLEVNEDSLKYLEKQVSQFKHLKNVKLKGKDPVFVVKAPLILIMSSPLPPSVEKSWITDFNLQKTSYYYYFAPKAKFLAIKIKSSKGRGIKKYVEDVLAVVNKKLTSPIIPIFDITKKVGQYYLIALVPESLKGIDVVLDKLSKFEIWVV